MHTASCARTDKHTQDRVRLGRAAAVGGLSLPQGSLRWPSRPTTSRSPCRPTPAHNHNTMHNITQTHHHRGYDRGNDNDNDNTDSDSDAEDSDGMGWEGRPTALATSAHSALVGLGLVIMLSSICVAVTTGLPARLHLHNTQHSITWSRVQHSTQLRGEAMAWHGIGWGSILWHRVWWGKMGWIPLNHHLLRQEDLLDGDLHAQVACNTHRLEAGRQADGEEGTSNMNMNMNS
jgi:hypothetical protein